jgi:hypothetical protein
MQTPARPARPSLWLPQCRLTQCAFLQTRSKGSSSYVKRVAVGQSRHCNPSRHGRLHLQVPWQAERARAHDGSASSESSALDTAPPGAPLLGSLAWLQLRAGSSRPSPEASPDPDPDPAGAMLVAVDRWGTLAAVDAAGRGQPLRLVGSEPGSGRLTAGPAQHERLPCGAWMAATGAAGGARERRNGQGFALCALGGAKDGTPARRAHRALALLGGGVAAVFAVAASRAAVDPPAPTVLTLPAAAMSGGASLGLPNPASAPVKACASHALTCTRARLLRSHTVTARDMPAVRNCLPLGSVGCACACAYTALPLLQQPVKPEL